MLLPRMPPNYCITLTLASSLTPLYSFSRTLINQRGAALGAEFRGKGVHVALGPDMYVTDARAV